LTAVTVAPVAFVSFDSTLLLVVVFGVASSVMEAASLTAFTVVSVWPLIVTVIVAVDVLVPEVMV